jgi:hypothetical protein
MLSGQKKVNNRLPSEKKRANNRMLGKTAYRHSTRNIITVIKLRMMKWDDM